MQQLKTTQPETLNESDLKIANKMAKKNPKLDKKTAEHIRFCKKNEAKALELIAEFEGKLHDLGFILRPMAKPIVTKEIFGTQAIIKLEALQVQEFENYRKDKLDKLGIITK